jgi:hypothetical protein
MTRPAEDGLICPWTREPIVVTTAPLPLSGFSARSSFWYTRLFVTRPSLELALRLRRGQSPTRKTGHTKPCLVCPFSGDPIKEQTTTAPTPVTGTERPLRLYRAVGPFWMTRWYALREELRWDISQFRGIPPTFLRRRLEIVGDRVPPEAVEPIPDTGSAAAEAVEQVMHEPSSTVVRP